MTTPGSGYVNAPAAVIYDGTLFDPIIGGTGATATATLSVQSVVLDSFGTGYTSAPTVEFSDVAPSGVGTGAAATVQMAGGAVTSIAVGNPGSGYITAGSRNSQDPLPGLCDPASAAGCPVGTKAIPLARGRTRRRTRRRTPTSSGSSRYRTQFSSSPALAGAHAGPRLRATRTAANAAISEHFPLTNAAPDGTLVPVVDAQGSQLLGVTEPH